MILKLMKMRILDLSAGNRSIWYDKKNRDCIYLDKRQEVFPDLVADTRCMPQIPTDNFDLLVFDPPHVNCGKNSDMSKRYGHHTTAQILETIKETAIEAHRVGKKDCLMALKWNDHDIKLQRVLDLMPQWEPLFGHLTKDGPGSKTYWVMLRRKD